MGPVSVADQWIAYGTILVVLLLATGIGFAIVYGVFWAQRPPK